MWLDLNNSNDERIDVMIFVFERNSFHFFFLSTTDGRAKFQPQYFGLLSTLLPSHFELCFSLFYLFPLDWHFERVALILCGVNWRMHMIGIKLDVSFPKKDETQRERVSERVWKKIKINKWKTYSIIRMFPFFLLCAKIYTHERAKWILINKSKISVF